MGDIGVLCVQVLNHPLQCLVGCPWWAGFDMIMLSASPFRDS